MKSVLFAVLGAAGSGRLALLSNLLEESSRLLVHVDERAQAIDTGISPEQIVPWKWIDGHIGIGGELPVGAELFFLSHGRESPVDFMEGLQDWLTGKPIQVGRVLTVVNCSLLAKHPKLHNWYNTCIYFSDAVLLGCREGISNAWINEFKKIYEDQNYPCYFRFIKKNKIDHPAEILYPEARRISLIFEEEEDKYDEEGNYMEEEYFLRDEAGRRLKWVPEITDFL
jgi:hypothetical protein